MEDEGRERWRNELTRMHAVDGDLKIHFEEERIAPERVDYCMFVTSCGFTSRTL